ncbi:ion transporter [Terasakiella sp. A23]|uniref:ion transporter n=1 Tax=Terasakiella sp. FCG-A23 TaxID=3080561 RepID=UPI002954F1CB|nr:ion transporter [Terasakiella sp. A23]MDV7338502.1 ion transporter [Terasakiella sp. A23]
MDLRTKVANWIEGPKVQHFITAVIIINAITLGLETDAGIMAEFGPALHLIDQVALSIYVVEILLKLFGRGLSFFKDGWNLFDTLVVGIALIPASGPLAVLRSFRILRVLRLLSTVPQMRAVIQALITAIPGMFSIIGLITVIFYVFAVLTTNFYQDTFTEWFGDIGASMYTLFQIMTLESWSMGIVRPVMAVHEDAYWIFIPFIMITTFAVVNLIIGVVVDAMQSQHTADAQEVEANAHDERENLLLEIVALRDEMKELKEIIKAK